MIHRALLEERVARLNRKKIRFIDDTLYHDEEAESAVTSIDGLPFLCRAAGPDKHRAGSNQQRCQHTAVA